MIKNIFNLSFEDSKKVIYKLKSMVTSNPTIAKTFQQNIMVYNLPTFILILIGFEFYIYETYSAESIKKIVMIIVGTLWLNGIFFLCIYHLFKHRNFAAMHKNKTLGGAFLLLGAGIGAGFNLLKNSFENAGVVSFLLQIIILIIAFSLLVNLTVTPSINKIEDKKEQQKKKRLISNVVKIEFIILCMSLLSALSYQHFKVELEDIIMKLISLAIFGTAYLIGIQTIFKIYLTYYYLEKYSRQYRLYYQIPDSVWYFSKEEAEKRNDPVYPPRRKKVSEEE